MLKIGQAIKWVAIAAVVSTVGYGLVSWRNSAVEAERQGNRAKMLESRSERLSGRLRAYNEYIAGSKDAEAIQRKTELFLNRTDVRKLIEEAGDDAVEEIASRISGASHDRLRQLEQATEQWSTRGDKGEARPNKSD